MITIFTSVWRNPDRPVILASQSPRRRDILSLMGFDFTVIAPSVENENVFFTGKAIGESLEALATAKAQSVSGRKPAALVLGADTIVCVDNAVLGKPAGRAEAAEMLRLLSGRMHSVYTSVALVCEECGFTARATEETRVVFCDLSDRDIDDYLGREEYRDKAGAYAIQGAAMVFIDRIEGCYYNVVGLPVRKTIGLFTAYSTRKDPQNA
jgi:septum formation protein